MIDSQNYEISKKKKKMGKRERHTRMVSIHVSHKIDRTHTVARRSQLNVSIHEGN